MAGFFYSTPLTKQRKRFTVSDTTALKWVQGAPCCETRPLSRPVRASTASTSTESPSERNSRTSLEVDAQSGASSTIIRTCFPKPPTFDWRSSSKTSSLPSRQRRRDRSFLAPFGATRPHSRDDGGVPADTVGHSEKQLLQICEGCFLLPLDKIETHDYNWVAQLKYFSSTTLRKN